MGEYIDFSSSKILEPSAGTGSFIKAIETILKPNKTYAFDLEPKYKNVVEKDFLTVSLDDVDTNLITVGNPPFGKRSKLAIDFFNKAVEFSHTVAFIVPAQFQKYSAQSKLNYRHLR